MQRVVLVRYGEIHLKGNNRPFFEKMLISRIAIALRDVSGAVVGREQGRFVVSGFAPDALDDVLDKLSRVFGIQGLCPAVELDKDLDQITQYAIELLRETNQVTGTFKVDARRADKKYPMDSLEIAKELGGRLLDTFEGLRVDVHHPQIRVAVEIRERAYVYVQSLPASGGMPVGCNGRVCLLLSGGIDSPVAGWMIAKRGVTLEAVHFESPPYTSERAREKVLEIARIMGRWGSPARLHIVPFTDIQRQLYDKGPDSQLTVLMRRYMMRIAERIAQKTQCNALVTGEAIGQVASQTLDSLLVTNDAVKLPVFRPLIGFDKLEIIERAQQIGTFETSILPYEDCCTVFMPKHPVTHPKLDNILASEALFDTEAMVADALERTEVVNL